MASLEFGTGRRPSLQGHGVVALKLASAHHENQDYGPDDRDGDRSKAAKAVGEKSEHVSRVIAAHVEYGCSNLEAEKVVSPEWIIEVAFNSI